MKWRLDKRLVLLGALVMILLGTGVAACSLVHSQDELSPPEQVAVNFVQAAYVHPNVNQIRPLVKPDMIDANIYQGDRPIIKPGPIKVGSVDIGHDEKMVCIYFSPGMSEYLGSYALISVSKERDGKWYVYDKEIKGRISMTFEQFQQSPRYQELNITDWKESELQ